MRVCHSDGLSNLTCDCARAIAVAIERLLQTHAPRLSVGVSPVSVLNADTKAVERLRVEVAKAQVESDDEPFENVARATGFSDAERMRRAFIPAFGKPPQSLRKSAREELTN
jgi:AraC-like DNA-binding protein